MFGSNRVTRVIRAKKPLTFVFAFFLSPADSRSSEIDWPISEEV